MTGDDEWTLSGTTGTWQCRRGGSESKYGVPRRVNVDIYRKTPISNLTIAAAGEVEEKFDDDWTHVVKFLPRLGQLAITMQIAAKSA